MRSLRRVLAGVLVAAAALLLPMSGISYADVSLSQCYAGGGHQRYAGGYFYCEGGDYHNQIIGSIH